MKKADAIFAALCRSEGLPDPVTEHRFHPVRKWRFDYAWPKHLVALEVEGGVWIAGRHTRGAGFVSDMDKYNEGSALGWRILRVQPKELKTQKTIDLLRRCICS
jgi:very-short-patch-repair endonuclease